MNDNKAEVEKQFDEATAKQFTEIIQRLHDNILLIQNQETIDQCKSLQEDYTFGRLNNPNTTELEQKKNQLNRIQNIIDLIKRGIEALEGISYGYKYFEDEKANLYKETLMIAHNLYTVEKNIEILKAGIDRILSSPMQLIVEANANSLANSMQTFTLFSQQRRDLYIKYIEKSEEFLNYETRKTTSK